jgi:hypothetical protein
MPIMKEKLAVAVAGKRFTKLVQRPLNRRMRGHVKVNETPGPDLESDESIKDTETCRDCDKEIASDKFMGMIAEKGSPALILGSVRLRELPHVLADGTRGEPNWSFRNISSAIRSSPQVGFSIAMRRISRLNSTGTGGLPTDLDFQRQILRSADRCQPMRVAGLTITKALRHSKRRASLENTKRSAAVVALGFFARSRNRASCLRRNRFSAASADRLRKSAPHNLQQSETMICKPMNSFVTCSGRHRTSQSSHRYPPDFTASHHSCGRQARIAG